MKIKRLKLKKRTNNQTNERQNLSESERLWEEIWDEIYEFQKTLDLDKLPEDQDELAKMGLYETRGRKGEKLIINKELDGKLFGYRCVD